MLSSKVNLATLMAVAEIASSSLSNHPGWGSYKTVTPKLTTYKPKMVTASDKEIAEWNEKVEAKRKAKRGLK